MITRYASEWICYGNDSARDVDNLNSHRAHIIHVVVRRLRQSEGVADASYKFPYKTSV